jgi:hypothetical protein
MESLKASESEALASETYWTRNAEYFSGLKLKYRRASRYPFLPVEPDPPVPPLK